MVLTTKHRMIIYRKFRRDIWGYSYTDVRCQSPMAPNIKNSPYFKPRPMRITKSNIYLIKSPYLKFFFGLWWRKRKMWRRKRRRYVYKFDRPPAFRKWRKYNRRFLSIRLTRLYFLTFQDHQFRKLFRRAAKMDGITNLIICVFWKAEQ